MNREFSGKEVITMHLTCNCKEKTMSLAVKSVEIGPIFDDSEDEPYPTFWRDVRIQTQDGELLELTLEAEEKDPLAIRIQDR
jgi:hypothetical protein